MGRYEELLERRRRGRTVDDPDVTDAAWSARLIDDLFAFLDYERRLNDAVMEKYADKATEKQVSEHE